MKPRTHAPRLKTLRIPKMNAPKLDKSKLKDLPNNLTAGALKAGGFNNKLVRFYVRYIIQRPSTIAIMSLLLLLVIVVPSVVLGLSGQSGVISNSLYVYLPLMIANVLLPTLFTWLLFSKTRQEGITFLVITQGVKRRTDYFCKVFAIYLISFAFAFTSSLILTIVKLGFGVVEENLAASFFLLLIIAILQIGFFSALMSIIALATEFVASTSIMTAVAALFIVSPIIASFIPTANLNQLAWNPASNRVNYALNYRVDANGKPLTDAELITYIDESNPINSGQENVSQKANFNLTPAQGAGILLDGFVSNPFRALLLASTRPSASTIRNTAQNYAGSLYRINDQATGSAASLLTAPTSLNSNNLVYAAQDDNPVRASFETVLNAFAAHLDLIQTNPLYSSNQLLTNPALLENWVNTMRTGGTQAWASENFPEGDVKTRALNFFLGLIPRQPLVYYLVRDHQLLFNKFNGLGDALKSRGYNASLVDAITFFLTNETVHTSIFSSNALFANSPINNVYPHAKVFNELKRADAYDVNRVKGLIDQVNTSDGAISNLTVQISNENTNYTSLSGANFPFTEGINSKQDWDSFVEASSQLGNLRAIYSRLNGWVTTVSRSSRLRQVNFTPNDLSIVAYRDIRALELVNDNVATSLFMTALILLLIISLWGAVRINERILIR